MATLGGSLVMLRINVDVAIRGCGSLTSKKISYIPVSAIDVDATSIMNYSGLEKIPAGIL